MRKIVLGSAVLLAVCGGFAWGFAAHRNHVVPYWQVKSLIRSLGLAHVPPAAKVPRHDLLPDGAEASGRWEQLASLPYVTGTRDPRPERRGVVESVGGRAAAGLNLYSPVTQAAAYLVDMQGRTVHEWSYGRYPWVHVHTRPDGSLLASVKDQRLLALDRRSKLLWQVRRRFHHSFWVTDDGTVWALTRRDERIPELHPDVECVVDLLTVISPEGEVLEEVSLLEVVRRSPYAYLLPEVAHRPADRDRGALDLLHTNHVQVFDGSQAHRSELFAAGNLLLSFRALSTVMIVDGETREVLWAWGPNNLAYQHHPTLLDDGHLLVFDNGSTTRGRSEVIELDPLTGDVVWTYTAEDLFTESRGAAQRLANGNTLITESDTGYVFEVTPEGERVWTFANPHFTPDGKRAALWWMTRHRPDAVGFGHLRGAAR